MKKKSGIFIIPCILLIFPLLFRLQPESNTQNAPPDKENSSAHQNSRNNLIPLADPQTNASTPLVFDDLELISGLEIVDLNRRRYIQLAPGSKKGRAEKYFFDNTARYDVEIFYLDESNGKSILSILINDRKAGDVTFDLHKAGNSSASYSSSYRIKTLQEINIQKWSKIVLEFSGDGDEKCRIEKLVFTPVGDFEGRPANLTKPVSLRIFETIDEQMQGRKVFSNYVQARIDSLAEKRKSELAALKTPAEWRARQLETKKQLHKFFGEFPEKTPLNAS